MDDADDVLRLALPQRHAGIGAGEDVVDDVAERLVGVDGVHGGAVDHDVGDVELAEVEQAAEAVALGLDHAALGVEQVDLAADLLGAASRIDLPSDAFQPASRSTPRTMNWTAMTTGENTATMTRDRRRDGARHPVGIADRQRLGQHLAEDQHEQGHRQRGVDDAGLAEQVEEQAGGQRRGEDVDQVVAEQQGADQALALLDQPADDAGAAVAGFLQLQHARPRGGGERGLGAGEESRQHDQKGNGQRHRPEQRAHVASCSARKAATSAGGTSWATKASPMPWPG